MLEAGAAGARLASLRLLAVTERDQRGWSGDVLHLFNLICSLPCRPVDEEPESSKSFLPPVQALLSEILGASSSGDFLEFCDSKQLPSPVGINDERSSDAIRHSSPSISHNVGDLCSLL
nr:uncharacterized protein LOC115934578 isoform X2 [Gorilla gorilla gorilla]